MTIYKSILAMLVSLTDFKAVAVVGIAFSSILIDLMFLFYYNCSSNYITQ